MSRSPLIVSAAALLAAGAVVAGVSGPAIDPADAARPFSVSKPQFTSVKNTATLALKRANAATAKADALARTGGVASTVPGPQGPQGPAGGFDPATVQRVVGPVVPVTADLDSVAYSLPCPAGTIALSGGWAASIAGTEKSFRATSSLPQSDLGGWTFRFAYSAAAGTSINVTPYVVCAGA